MNLRTLKFLTDITLMRSRWTIVYCMFSSVVHQNLLASMTDCFYHCASRMFNINHCSANLILCVEWCLLSCQPTEHEWLKPQIQNLWAGSIFCSTAVIRRCIQHHKVIQFPLIAAILMAISIPILRDNYVLFNWGVIRVGQCRQCIKLFALFVKMPNFACK